MPDLPPHTPPKGLDFKKGLVTKLHYSEVVEKGLILEEIYADPQNLDDIILKVKHTYNLDMATLLYTSIDTIIEYFNEDDSVSSEKKEFSKILTARQQLKLAKQRRDTVRNSAEAKTLGLLIQLMTDKTVPEIMALGGSFLVEYNNELDVYVKSGSTLALFNKLDSDSSSWLDLDIPNAGIKVRDFIKSEFI